MSFPLGNKLLEKAFIPSCVFVHTQKTFPSLGIYFCSWSPLTHFTSLQYECKMGDREEKWIEKTSLSLYGFIIFFHFHAFLAMFSQLFYSLQTTYIIFLSQCINQQISIGNSPKVKLNQYQNYLGQ